VFAAQRLVFDRLGAFGQYVLVAVDDSIQATTIAAIDSQN
jgi:hypothetical protein